MRQLVEDAKKIISLASITSDGNEELANHVASLMRARGLKVQLQLVSHSLDGVSKRQFNVLGVFGDPLVDKKTRKGLLLDAHLDTVGPGRLENWTETGSAPFTATIKDGRIYGLGAADSKLDFLCKLRAIERFREQKLKMPIYLVGSCGEGLGMFGAKYLIKSMVLNPRYVMIGEPTALAVIREQKAALTLRVTIGYSRMSRDARGFNRRVTLSVAGVGAHAANPEGGDWYERVALLDVNGNEVSSPYWNWGGGPLEPAGSRHRSGSGYLPQVSGHFRTPNDVDLFFGLGQRLSQLTYNFNNKIGSGFLETRDGGLLQKLTRRSWRV